MYAVLIQKQKNNDNATFHIEELEKTPEINITCLFAMGYANPFSLIGLHETYEDAEAFVKKVRKKYKAKFGRNI